MKSPSGIRRTAQVKQLVAAPCPTCLDRGLPVHTCSRLALHFKDVPVFDWISVLSSLSICTKMAETPLLAMMSMDIECVA